MNNEIKKNKQASLPDTQEDEMEEEAAGGQGHSTAEMAILITIIVKKLLLMGKEELKAKGLQELVKEILDEVDIFCEVLE